MKKRITTALILMAVGLFWTSLALGQSNATDAGQENGAYDQARALYQQGQYDEVVKLLAGPAAANAYDLKINVLLARAMIAKCARMKAAGDKAYRYEIKQPYIIGIRLFKGNPTLPEPYYLIAKSLLINNRPYKASRFIEKAIYFSGPQDPHYPEYMMTKGDCWVGIMARKDRRGYDHAKKSYEMALSAAGEDSPLSARLKARLENLEKNK
ncbi:MAG: hypothetical protein P8X55_14175 [Desulfosarcinaceae bacterium]